MEIEQLNTRVSKELKKQLKLIAVREGRELEEIINEQLETYVKNHGEGNPIYPLDKWQDPNFKPFPAFMETIDNKWHPYIKKCNKNEAREIMDHSEMIFKLAKRKFYDTF